MNDDLSPLEPDTLDELLSAELDGAFDAAAHDLGMDPDDARARIGATPGAEDRRVGLRAARDLLAETPELDPLLAKRLRAKAVRAATEDHATRNLDRRQRRRRTLVGACGFAASIVVAVAIAAGVHNGGSDRRVSAPTAERSLGGAANGAPKTSSAGLRSLGKFTDARVLAAAAVLESSVQGDRTRALAQTTKPPPGGASTTTAAGYAYSPSAVSSTAAPAGGSQKEAVADGKAVETRPAPRSCAPPVATPNTAVLELRARATLSGKPVTVFVFSGNGEHVVEIVGANCSLVSYQTMS